MALCSLLGHKQLHTLGMFVKFVASINVLLLNKRLEARSACALGRFARVEVSCILSFIQVQVSILP